MKQGWEIKKLGEVCTFCSGYTPKENELSECGAVPYFKVSDMNHCDNLKYLTYTSLFLEDRCKVYPKHTIVFPKNGAAIATNKKRILAQDSVVDLNTGGVIANDAVIYYEYLYLYFLSLDFRLHTRRGAVPTLDIAELKHKSIPVPLLPIQEKIVAELDCLSGIIEKKKQQLKELDALAESIFYTMFGDPITNEKGWEVIPLSSAVDEKCPISYGIVQPLDDIEGGVPIVRPVDLTDTFIYNNGLKRTSKEISDSYKRTILRGDEILMCVRGTTGIVSLASEELCGCNTTRGIVPLYFSDMNRWYMFYLFKSRPMVNLIADYTQGIALKQINIKDLRQLPIIKPAINVQQEFADKIEAIEKQKELIKKSIKETEELFNSRMDYYFGLEIGDWR